MRTPSAAGAALRRATASAAVLGLALSLALATPAAAGAGAAGGTAVRQGAAVVYTASGRVANDVVVGVLLGEVAVQDEAGVTAGPGCVRRSDVLVTCGPVEGVSRVAVRVRDGDDRVHVAAPVDASVDAGTGRDEVTTHGGGDRIVLRDGAPGDTVRSCGGGEDHLRVDAGDTVPASGCEHRATA
ncbi:hypothetical protein [Streptomyces kanasensis]|uniref:hypothetical protein n=1 Tax=Streptomyces kanasensis TaxID=936756 RepID=UPI0037FBA7BA